tara:strand:- start:1075 stop:1209 length:135 start_codon:yes stop_codon:yes gene_type:complete
LTDVKNGGITVNFSKDVYIKKPRKIIVLQGFFVLDAGASPQVII